MTQAELKSIMEKVVDGDMSSLQAIAKDPKATPLQLALASALITAINKRDWWVIDKLLERIVGKVKDKVEHSGSVGAQVIVTIPDNGRKK